MAFGRKIRILLTSDLQTAVGIVMVCRPHRRLTTWERKQIMQLLIDENRLAARIRELGEELCCFYRGKPLTVVIVLNGALFFAADLLRHLQLPELQCDTFAAGSYCDDRSSGRLEIRADVKLPVAGRHVLILDDVLDTGLTLGGIVGLFRRRAAASVRTCVLLEKDRPRSAAVVRRADWRGFAVADCYVVGYGLDSRELFRQLPYIAVLDAGEETL